MTKSSKGTETGAYNAPFARSLRDKLKERGMTNKELAEHLGVSQQAVNLYTAGNSMPTVDKIVKIAEFFGVSVDFLLGRSRAAAPDDFIQEAVRRYGLSEGALRALEGFNNASGGLVKGTQARIALEELLTLKSVSGEPWAGCILRTIFRYCHSAEDGTPLPGLTRGASLTAEQLRNLELLDLQGLLIGSRKAIASTRTEGATTK
jgi:transcriptional regulator with XRE-family HTH domain